MIDERDYSTRFHFRPRGPHERPEHYRRKLIEHVRARDLAAAHELVVGRVQPEWTPADIEAFTAAAEAMRGVIRDRGLAGELFVLPDAAPIEPNAPAFLALCDERLGNVRAMREERPDLQLLLFASVLMLDGAVISCAFTERGDRVSVIKTMARHLPVFGFLVIADSYLHGIDKVAGTATKTDALIAQIGTRDGRRITRAWPYHFADGRALFDPPRPDVEHGKDGWLTSGDVYAEIFVSVPPSSARPS